MSSTQSRPFNHLKRRRDKTEREREREREEKRSDEQVWDTSTLIGRLTGHDHFSTKKSQIGLKNTQHVYFIKYSKIIKAKEIKAVKKDWEQINERFKALSKRTENFESALQKELTIISNFVTQKPPEPTSEITQTTRNSNQNPKNNGLYWCFYFNHQRPR
jgi:hypothetical protein